MKSINVIFYSLILGVFFISCGKEQLANHAESSTLGFVGKKGNVSIVVNSYSFSEEVPVSIDVEGHFFDKKGDILSVDYLAVAGIQIDKNQGEKFASHFNYFEKGRFDSVVSAVTGTEVEVAFGSSGNGNVSTSLITTDPVKLKLDRNTNGAFRKSEGLRIRWNPSVSDASRDGNDSPLIGVAVVYHAGESLRYDSTLPSSNVTIKKTAFDNEGEVFFSPADLSELPSNGTVVVYIGRYVETIIHYQSVENLISYLTYSSSEGLTVLE